MSPRTASALILHTPPRRGSASFRPILGLVLLLGGALAATEVGAVDRFVDSLGGLDVAGCTDPLAPCQSIEHAIDESVAGDAINLISLAGLSTVFFESGLEIPFDLTIRGEGMFRTTIDAQGADRLLTVTGGAEARIDRLTLRNGVVANGLATDQGGAILVDDGDLLVVRSRLLDNQALVGGAIAAPQTAGDVVIVASVVRGNLGTGSGGGVWCDGCGRVTAVLSALSDNVAGGLGGAVYAFDTEATVQSGRLMRNNADEGGAVYANVATLNVFDSELADNEADNGDGGAVFVGGTLNLQRSTLAGNVAPVGNGGAVYAGGNTLVLGSNTTFSGNEAAAGGALSLPSNFGTGPTVRIGTSTFHGNLSTFAGAAEHIAGDWDSFILHNSIVTAGPLAGGLLDPFCTRALDIGLHNRIDDVSCDNAVPAFNLGAVTDLDPALAFNGGVGRTHLPGAASNALDEGLNAVCLNPASGNPLVFDQRRRTRPVDFDANGVAECDVGAVERQ